MILVFSFFVLFVFVLVENVKVVWKSVEDFVDGVEFDSRGSSTRGRKRSPGWRPMDRRVWRLPADGERAGDPADASNRFQPGRGSPGVDCTRPRSCPPSWLSYGTAANTRGHELRAECTPVVNDIKYESIFF